MKLAYVKLKSSGKIYTNSIILYYTVSVKYDIAMPRSYLLKKSFYGAFPEI